MLKQYFLLVVLLLCAPVMTGCIGNMNDSGRADASNIVDLSTSPREVKMKELENTILSNTDHAMDTVDLYFADLMFTRRIAISELLSLTNQVDEAWMYSLTDDITVVVDIDRRRPLAWFHGKVIDADELTALKAGVHSQVR